jgi:hypothetical protein
MFGKGEKRIFVFPYKKSSEGGKAVAEALGAKTILSKDEDFQPKNGDFIVDWGCGYKPLWSYKLEGKDITFLNHWQAVARSVNKIDTFQRFLKNDVPHPQWTFKVEEALKWIKAGNWVCCRQEVEGMDGAGLVLARTADQLCDAKLYTRYMPIEKEFRVYVFRDEMLDIREKRRDTEALQAGKVNEYIRTTSGNWVFCQFGIKIPKDIADVSIRATKALGLDFAGVDVIQAKEDGRCYVLETNTAPYVGYNTTQKLKQAILQVYNNK